jgi:hypothetical protein
MNTVEELFKAATQALEEEVFYPTVLAKLAERGYKPQNDQETVELLKHANVVREKVAAGEWAPIPTSEMDEQGQVTKTAADKASQDFLAFAPDAQIVLKDVKPVVKEAATVLAWGFLQSTKQQAAEATK